MTKIFDMFKEYLTPDTISNVAKSLGEDSSKVTSAATAIIPGLVGSIFSNSDSPKISSLLKQAGESTDLLSGAMGLLSGKANEGVSSIGGKLTDLLLGSKLGDFESSVAKHSGVAKGNIGRLVAMLSPLVAGVIGRKANVAGGLTNLVKQIGFDKGSLLKMLPSGMGSALGFASGLNVHKPDVKINAPLPRKKGGNGWVRWLLILLALLLLLFGWRACKRCSTDRTATIENLEEKAHDVLEKAEQIAKNTKEEFSLPNGVKFSAFKGGIEDQLIKFMASDDFKNATPDELKNRWFNFDNIEFEFGSSTELTPGSQAQLDNLAEILKYYKFNFKIGAYTDKVGADAANLELSQKRADALKKKFEAAGLTAQIVGAEGYGEQFAQYAEDAPESDRVKDRKLSISIRK